MASYNAYKISIPKPCHEDWDTMTNTEKGKFCNACQKNVIDFTRLSDNEIVKIIEQTNGNMCGRFSSTQLNREIYFEKYNAFLPLKARLVGGLLALAVLQPVISNASQPKEIEINIPFVDISETEKNELENAEIPTHDTTKYTIRGIVVDSLTKEPIPFANVLVQNTSYGTATDIDGKFTLVVNGKCTLKISSLGYGTIVIELTEEVLEKNEMLNIQFAIYPIKTYLLGGPMIEVHSNYRVKEKNTVRNPTDAERDFLLRGNR